jgi:hypothetical protein
LNEKGTVVGRSLNAALAYIPFVWDSALGMRPLPVPPGAAAGGALGVNDDGLIVGEGTLPIGGIAALWDGPTVYDLNTLRAPNTSPVLLQSAIAINNEGWILCRSGPTSGVLLRPRSCYPDCTGDGALSVSDFGCFQTEFVLGSRYADCNQDGTRTVADFGCFQTKFVAGCP